MFNGELNFKSFPSTSPFLHSQHRLSLFSLCCARTPLPTLFALPHITQALLFCCTFSDMPKSQRCSSESGEGALGSVPLLGPVTVCVSSAQLNYYQCYLFTLDCNCFPSVEKEQGGGYLFFVWSATSVFQIFFFF